MRRVRLGEAPVAVPFDVLLGIDVVRESGLTNMLNRPLVAELARAHGFPKTATWISNHPDLYAEGVFRGFAVEKTQKGTSKLARPERGHNEKGRTK